MAQMVKKKKKKKLPALQKTPVQSLDQEDPLEKGMETHSSFLEIPHKKTPITMATASFP